MRQFQANKDWEANLSGVRFSSRVAVIKTCALCLFALLNIQACTPAVYQIDLKYMPPERSMKQARPNAKITVAVFNDIRQMDDRLLLGQIETVGGSVIPILPRHARVPEAVTDNIRDFLSRAGYQVTVEKPVWNLKEEAIHPDWGKLLIGGNVDSLEIRGENSVPVTTYRTKVRLTFVIADTAGKRILYRSSVETSSSLKDISLSGERIEQEINSTLTDALMKMFNDPATITKIDTALSERQTK